MAKKNLHSLMSGIIGDNDPLPSNAHVEPSVAPQHSPESVSSKTQPDSTTKRGPGRPKKNDGNDNTRATFIVSAELLRKIKYISLMDERLQSEVVGEALSLYVSKWENDNGKIKLPKR